MDKKRNFFYLFVLFLVLSVASFLYGFFTNFVENSFIIMKPITAFQYSVFLCFIFCCLVFQERLERDLTKNKKELYIGLGFFIAMLSLFEVFWNFFYWFSLYGLLGLPTMLDDIRNLISHNITFASFFNTTTLQTSGLYPINMNIASKLWFVLFFGALYWIYFVLGAEVMEDG